jgi:hypothetical protein
VRQAARIAALVAAALTTAPAVAHALPAEGPREVVDVELTTGEPGAPTGVTYRMRLRHPTDPSAPPPVLRRLVVGAPEGGVIDTSVPERCTASDDELRLRGDGICPPGSIVGTGTAEILVEGFGRQRFETTAFNERDQQVETVKQGGRVNAVVRGFFTPEGLDALIPTCILGGQPPDGCPSDQSRLLENELVLPVYNRDGRTYQRNPPTCPPSGRWRTPVILTFADGVVERVFPEQPCTRTGTGEPAGAPAACRSRRRIALRGLARRDLRSATARIRGRRVRLDPRRPVIDLRGLPRGRYAIRVTAVTRTGKRITFVRRYRTCG